MQSLSPKRSNHTLDVNRSRSFNDGAATAAAHRFWEKDPPPTTVLIDEAGDRFVWEHHTMTLTRVAGFGFGIAVSGGTDNPHFASGDPSVAISDVLRAGPAEGKLLINDRILSANGAPLEGVDNATAIRVLMESGDTVALRVRRKTLLAAEPDETPRRVVLARARRKADYGVVLGCRLYVRRIVGDSVAANDGTVREGDTVLKLNGTAVETLSLADAQKIIDKGNKDKLSLVISRGAARPPPPFVVTGSGGSMHDVNYAVAAAAGMARPASAHDARSPDGRKPSNIEGLQRMPSRNRNPVYEAGGLGRLEEPPPGGVAVARTPSSPGSGGDEPPRSPPVPPPPPPPAQPHPGLGDRQLALTNGQLPVPIYEGYYSNVGQRAPPDPRFISFRKEGSVGIRLTGGNEVGIFVAAVQPRSAAALAGLRPGDRMLKVNERAMESVTREEAVLFLLSLRDQIDMIVQFRRDEYERVVAIQLGDSFYVRAHFNYEQTEKGELSFRTGDVFHVKDTLHNGVVGAWEVARVGRGNEETQIGVLPNQSRAEQLALAAAASGNGSGTKTIGRSTFFRRRKSARRSKSLNRDHWDEIVFSEAGSKFPAYEKVRWKYPGFVRPVVIFGALADVARERLLADMPDSFESPQTEAGDGSGGSEKNNRSGIVRLGAIREIIERDRHAVIDVTPNAVDRLNYAQYYPIVVFLRADGKSQVKTLRARAGPGAGRGSRKLYETGVRLEKTYAHLFTATVSLTTASDAWYARVRDAVDAQQQQPVWMSDAKLGGVGGLDDEFLFPMTTRLSYASRDAESDLDVGSDTEGVGGGGGGGGGGGLRPSSLFGETFRASRPIARASSVSETDQAYDGDPDRPVRYHGDRAHADAYYAGYYGDRGGGNRIEAYATLTPRQRHMHATYAPPPAVPGVCAKPPRQFDDDSDMAANRYPTETEDFNGGLPRQRFEPAERDAGGAADFARCVQQSVNEKFGTPMTGGGGACEKPPPPRPTPSSRLSAARDLRTTRPGVGGAAKDELPAIGAAKVPSRVRTTAAVHTGQEAACAVEGTRGRAARSTASSPLSCSRTGVSPAHTGCRRAKYGEARDVVAARRPAASADGGSWRRGRTTGVVRRQHDGRASRGPAGRRCFQASSLLGRPASKDAQPLRGQTSSGRRLAGTDATPAAAPPAAAAPAPPTSQSSAIPAGDGSRVKYGSPAATGKDGTSAAAPSRDKDPLPAKLAKPLRESPLAGALSATAAAAAATGEPRRSAFAPYTKPTTTNGPKDASSSSSSSSRPAPPPKPPKPVVSSLQPPPPAVPPLPPATSSSSSEKPLPPTEPPIGENHRVVATARGTFDHTGGELVSAETGVSIVVPRGAIPEGVRQEIYFKVCQDSSILPPLDAEKGETLLSPLVMCGPHGLKFQQPVELRLPHSASVNPESWSFALKSSETPTGQPTEWQNVQLAGVDGVSQPGRVGANSVSVLVDHF
ncbi:PREDICTED: tight junction protein ZO-1-like [Priapulus caudatus]|uniref:Tight junction protein ZO-1-like n=1 Tax=Priapulus caudatus TaxID=37621 RepID=A0ABM1DQW1_PRICU|nr:PREDICTED: tight junction protein ZO-1-like [Priapulus caudatus]QRF78306.1 ZO1 [Priapulus caudatus]